MAIYNFTPHSINIIDGAEFDPSIRKWVGGEEVRTIPSSGMLNAQLTSVEAGNIEGIPLWQQEITGCDPLPGYIRAGDVVIVSALYATAYKANGGYFPLYGVKDPVMTFDGKTFRGCRGLQRF